MADDYLCTTVLEFDDCYEGQVMHVGDKESCERTANLISALSYSGNRTVLSSKMIVIPQNIVPSEPMKTGQCWRHPKRVSISPIPKA